MKWQHFVFYFFLIWYSVGVILVGFDWVPSWLEWANSVFIITAGVLGVIYFMRTFGTFHGTLISSLIFIGSFAIEYVGSTYSLLFGSYYYTNNFAPNLFDVPIAIGFAWIMVIATSHAIVHAFSVQSNWLRAAAGALLAVLFDLVLDPVSYSVKSYWIWEEPGFYYDIPITNFTGWFITAFILHVIIELFFKAPKTDSIWQRRMVLLYSLMIAMFAFIAFMNGLYLAGSIPVICLLLLLFFMRRGVHYA